MGRLGDYLPERMRNDSASRQLVPGRILRLVMPFAQGDRNKYVVVAHGGTEPLLFIINSEINPYILKRRSLRDCQVCLKATAYDFLRHDSYVDCSQPWDGLGLSDIVRQLSEDTRRVVGDLDSTSMGAIVGVVHAARTLSKRQKQLIIDALS